MYYKKAKNYPPPPSIFGLPIAWSCASYWLCARSGCILRTNPGIILEEPMPWPSAYCAVPFLTAARLCMHNDLPICNLRAKKSVRLICYVVATVCVSWHTQRWCPENSAAESTWPHGGGWRQFSHVHLSALCTISVSWKSEQRIILMHWLHGLIGLRLRYLGYGVLRAYKYNL